MGSVAPLRSMSPALGLTVKSMIPQKMGKRKAACSKRSSPSALLELSPTPV